MRSFIPLTALHAACLLSCSSALAVETPRPPGIAEIHELLRQSCLECHDEASAEGGFDLASLPWEPRKPQNRNRWIRVHDRVQRGEMPPDPDLLPAERRERLVGMLGARLHAADLAEVTVSGRGPLRRLSRGEYEQTLRDILALPFLDIRDMLPEEREGHLFNKTTSRLDISRVQLTALLDATETALRQAVAGGVEPPAVKKYRAVGTRLFPARQTFGNREAMFFARNSEGLDDRQLDESPGDPHIEMALFRSAHWPYYGYPQGFVAALPGRYRVRFSARAVRQLSGFRLVPAHRPVPMTFRARKPSGPDVSGDVRATGGLMDIRPERADYETIVQLRAGETFEYSLLGLPVPLARNVNNGPPTYRYPPFPEEGQRGVAFQWLEVEGPLSPEDWPPRSHRLLFGELPLRAAPNDEGLPVEVVTKQPRKDARRLLRRFVTRAAPHPVDEETWKPFLQLILERLDAGAPFAEAMLTGYQAFLCSPHVLYLREPLGNDRHFDVATRLSYFLTETRPDSELLGAARDGRLRDSTVLTLQARRLVATAGFERFVRNFTDYWLELRHLYRDEPNARLYPEYRFDAYLVESMERETRAFFSALLRENLPVRVMIESDFVFANDRLAEHYGLPPLSGSTLRKITLPATSPYGGLLSQGAILKVTANGTATSPVVRGAWVMERLLGQPPPPPPAGVPAVEPDIRGANTIRELLELHTKSDACAGCHARFDPVGMALEGFDILGSRRTRYRGLEAGDQVTGIDRAGHDFAYTLTAPVDTSGELLDGRTFRDIRELKGLLAADPRQLARNLLHQFTVYATGTPVRFSDRAEIEAMLDACEPDGYRVGDLLLRFVRSRVFLGPPGCE